jgi:biopolymer transport protein ExbD
MMEMSRRAKRMERHHVRNKPPAINLISLMDVFTILVFFLLISSSNVQQLPKKKDVKLPDSFATKAPRETLIISVTRQSILVQGKEVAIIDDVKADAAPLIKGLEDELNFHASRKRLYGVTADASKAKAVTIMGDENMPYELLRKILATCREVNYTQIAFAAMQKTRKEEKL